MILAGVHGGAAADGDDAVGLEGSHLAAAPSLAQAKRGVGRDVEEGGVRDAHLVQLVGDGLGVAVVDRGSCR